MVDPMMYGDVKIYPYKSGGELEQQIGLSDWVIIEKDQKSFIALNFDTKKQFSGFSFWNRGNNIMDYAIPHKYKDHDSVSYGTVDQNLFWMDYNSDGIFDFQRTKDSSTKSILIDDEWVKVKAGSKRVIVEIDETEIEYDFNRDMGKWLPVSDINNELPSAAE